MIKSNFKKTGYISEEGSMDYELKLTKQQDNFTNWMYSKIKPYIFGDILETGSGCGTFSEKVIKDFNGKIYLSEIDPEFIKILKKDFKRNNIEVIKLDLNNSSDFKRIDKKFDSIICLNVLEHVKDDILALKLMRHILNKKGKLILLVPSHKFLFCEWDKVEGHYRRYSKSEIEKKAKIAGFRIKKSFWFDMIAIPARFIAGNILNVKKTPPKSLGLFNRLIPIISFLEEYFFLEVIGVSRVLILENTV